jgi:hypothetical protein
LLGQLRASVRRSSTHKTKRTEKHIEARVEKIALKSVCRASPSQSNGFAIAEDIHTNRVRDGTLLAIINASVEHF